MDLVQNQISMQTAKRIQRRWLAVLRPGTWPEILRRYILIRTGDLAQAFKVAVQTSACCIGRQTMC